MKFILCFGVVWLLWIDLNASAADISELAHENDDSKSKYPASQAREWLENVQAEAQKQSSNGIQSQLAMRDLISDLKVRSSDSSSSSISSFGFARSHKKWKKAMKRNRKYGRFSPYVGPKPFNRYGQGPYGGFDGGYNGGFGNFDPYAPGGVGGYPMF